MKSKFRILPLVLVIVLFFTMIPLYETENTPNFYAATNQEKDILSGMKQDEEMIDLALEYFPEYSEKINTPVRANALLTRGIQNDDVLVINETKIISEDEKIIYQEYVSGRANILFVVDQNIVNTQSGNGYTYECIDVQVYSLFLAGSMYIDNFAYTIYDNKYDVIRDFGDTSISNLTVNTIQKVANETANGPATAIYGAVFGYPDGSFFDGMVMSCALEITVGNNQCTIEAY